MPIINLIRRREDQINVTMSLQGSQTEKRIRDETFCATPFF